MNASLQASLAWIRTLGWPQFVCGVLLIGTLAALALIFGRRQLLALRVLPQLPPGDQGAARWQAMRRLLGCCLLVFLAALLALAIFSLEIPAEHLARERASDPDHVLSPEQRHFVMVYSTTWLAILTLLVLLVLLTAREVYVIRRQSYETRRRLLAEHKALLDDEASARRRRYRE